MKLISEFSPRVFLLLVLGVSSAFLGVRFALEMVVKFLALTYCEQRRTLGHPCDDSNCLPGVIEKSQGWDPSPSCQLLHLHACVSFLMQNFLTKVLFSVFHQLTKTVSGPAGGHLRDKKVEP